MSNQRFFSLNFRSISFLACIFVQNSLFSIIVEAENSKCSSTIGKGFPAADADYLKSVMEKLSEKTYSTADGRFQLRVCEKATAAGIKNDKAGLIDTKNSVVIGLFDEVSGESIGGTSGAVPIAVLRFNNGEMCKTNISRHAIVTVVCDNERKEPEFRFVSPDDNCTYTFVLVTKSFCAVPHSSDKPATAAPAATTTAAAAAVAPSKSSSSHMSPVTGFFLFLLALAFGYCLVGFLYKRYVLGARGAQQIPNYLFWIRVTNSVQDCVSNRSSARYAASSSHNAEYDRANAADVQLMNDDDFKFDQPSAAVGQGQASTFRQQQLNAAPTQNTPNVNAQRQQQQQQPLLLPQDDADERLLQV